MCADPRVIAVCAGSAHGPFKPVQQQITLVPHRGVVGDAHFGRTVQHRSRARVHPGRENLRQVHLIGQELHEELSARGLPVSAGEMGENVLTRDLDLLAMPVDTVLRLGTQAEVELTGLRNPCRQLDGVRAGLMAAVLGRTEEGGLVRRAGVMAVVRAAGTVRAGDTIMVLPPEVHRPLRPI